MNTSPLLLMVLAPAAAFAGSFGPGPETFNAAGHFIFRNEAEAIARKVAATRDIEESHVVEVRVESTTMTPGGRGWGLVVVGKVPGGCHAVNVGISVADGRVYAIEDRRALPAKPPADCERWFIEGAEGAMSNIATAPMDEPPPTPRVAGRGKGAPPKAEVRIRTRDEIAKMVKDQAAKKGYTTIEPQRIDYRASGEGGGIWRADLIGLTPEGCGIYKIEIKEPEGKMRYQNNQMAGKKVELAECRDWYEGDGRLDTEMDWLPGRVEFETVTTDNLQ